ncbi:MAG: GNAT family N-acetyltransferase [Verrucomicrobiales bacterium]
MDERPGFNEHLPLIAFVDGRAAAMGSLHQRLGGWKRHIGKVHFLTNPDHRGLGLIDLLLREIIEVAKHCGLTRLESELNRTHHSAEIIGRDGLRRIGPPARLHPGYEGGVSLTYV